MLELKRIFTIMKIICIPGLGGHKNVFRNYAKEFSDFDVKFVQLINWRKTSEEVARMVDDSDEPVVLLCNCYCEQTALRVMYHRESKIAGLVVIEPFFWQFAQWQLWGIWMSAFWAWVMKYKKYLGLGRKKLGTVDYALVEQQPLFLQPLFDLKHQRSEHYFEKVHDIATFRLPPRVETKTLFIFSPKGWMRDPTKREKLKQIFVASDLVELGGNTHNIVTVSRHQIAEAVRNWLREL